MSTAWTICTDFARILKLTCCCSSSFDPMSRQNRSCQNIDTNLIGFIDKSDFFFLRWFTFIWTSSSSNGNGTSSSPTQLDRFRSNEIYTDIHIIIFFSSLSKWFNKVINIRWWKSFNDTPHARCSERKSTYDTYTWFVIIYLNVITFHLFTFMVTCPIDARSAQLKQFIDTPLFW